MGLMDTAEALTRYIDELNAKAAACPHNQTYVRLSEFKNLATLLADLLSEGITMAIDVIVNGFPYPPEDLIFAMNVADVDVTWRKAQGDVTGHRVYRATDAGPFAQIGADLLPTDEAYTDVAPAAGHVYQYYVVGFNTNGESGKSNTVIVDIPV